MVICYCSVQPVKSSVRNNSWSLFNKILVRLLCLLCNILFLQNKNVALLGILQKWPVEQESGKSSLHNSEISPLYFKVSVKEAANCYCWGEPLNWELRFTELSTSYRNIMKWGLPDIVDVGLLQSIAEK